MRFTWWTYIVAVRRAFKRESYFYNMHAMAFAPPDKWIKAGSFAHRLGLRRARERKGKFLW